MKKKGLAEGKLLDKRTPSLPELAKRYKMKLSDLKKELDRGTKVELEHTKKRSVAREIALDHLGEKPNYYKLLKKIES